MTHKVDRGNTSTVMRQRPSDSPATIAWACHAGARRRERLSDSAGDTRADALDQLARMVGAKIATGHARNAVEQ